MVKQPSQTRVRRKEKKNVTFISRDPLKKF